MRRPNAVLCLTLCALAIGLTANSARAATFTVSNTTNSGAGSLRQAILDANATPGADGIQIVGFAGVIPIDSPLPDITDDVTIDGLDDGQTVTLQPSRDFRAFNIPRANVLLANLEISGGVAEDETGGAINNGSGQLTLLKVRLIGNRASQGGAVFSTGPVLVRDSEISNNFARNGVGSGGAISMNGGALTISNSRFDGNLTSNEGGIIAARGGTRVIVTGGALTNNKASRGGAIYSSAGDISIAGTTISGNSAGIQGGALWSGATGTLTVNNSNLNDNSAANQFGPEQGGGGGIYSDGGTTVVRDTTMQGNRVVGGGAGGAILNTGGSLQVKGGALSQNFANGDGGAIATIGGSVTLEAVDLRANQTFSEGGALHVKGKAFVFVVRGIVEGNSAFQGGAFWNSTGNTMRVDGTQFRLNSADGDQPDRGGGALYNDGGTLIVRNAILSGNRVTGQTGAGGAIFNRAGRLEFVGSTATGNSARTAGGAIESQGAASNILIDAKLTSNIAGPEGFAAPGNGGGLHVTGAAQTFIARGEVNGNTAAGEGGGLWNSKTGTLVVDGTQFGGNIAAGEASDEGGGAIYGDGGRLTIRNAGFLKNRATGAAGSGGAVLNNGGFLQVVGGGMSDNTANRAGGAIETRGNGGAQIINCNFSGNVAGGILNSPGGTANPGNGGALHMSDGDNILIIGGLFSSNYAFNEGGALWSQRGGRLTVQGASLDNNRLFAEPSAISGGGGIYNNGGVLTLRDVTLRGNFANDGVGSGGGVLNNGGTVAIVGGSFVRNDASRVGGGLETLGGRVTLTNVLFEGNRANGIGGGLVGSPSKDGDGGALHISGAGQVLVVGGAIAGNQAASQGGGAWCSSNGTLILERVTFSGNIANFGANPDAQMPAGASGGGVYNAGGTLGVRDAVFDENQALGGGGALFNGGTASIEGTRLSNNVASGGQGDGGAIFSSGPLTLNRCTLRANRAARAGGAIENAGRATILNSTLSGNIASENGGALHNVGAGLAFFIGSTIVSNRAQGAGGGLWNGAGATISVRNSTLDSNFAGGETSEQGGAGIYLNGGTVSLDSATITENTARGGGGGVFNKAGTLNSLNSIIALNRAGSAVGGPDVIGSLNSQGFNFVGVSPDSPARTGDLFGTAANPLDPQLGDLADNGGTTQTRLPQSGSPVIDAGNTSATTDQRGTPRPQGARADIGAVEVESAQNSANQALLLPSKAPSGGAS